MIPFEPIPQVRGAFGGRKSFTHHAPASPKEFLQLRQRHGDRIHLIWDRAQVAAGHGAEGDALVTTLTQVPLAVRTADCVPILIAHPRGVVAAVHAGWRGTLLKIAFQALKKMEAEFSAPLSEAWVALGPAICRECFEIGEDVAGPFKKIIRGERVLLPRGEKYRLDLHAANVEQILAAGVSPKRIQVHGICTRCQEVEYFSHRGAMARGEANEGRNYSWIVLA